jgi:hypothetical protein
MAIHTIRLRAPWKCESRDDRELWRRGFNCPTGLSEFDRVRLVFRADSTEALAILNEQVLGTVAVAEQPIACDVTEMLRARNELTLSIPRAAETDEERREPPVDVRLEIESNS